MSAEQSKQSVTAAPDVFQHLNDDHAARLQIAPPVWKQPNTRLQDPCTHASQQAQWLSHGVGKDGAHLQESHTQQVHAALQ